MQQQGVQPVSCTLCMAFHTLCTDSHSLQPPTPHSSPHCAARVYQRPQSAPLLCNPNNSGSGSVLLHCVAPSPLSPLPSPCCLPASLPPSLAIKFPVTQQCSGYPSLSLTLTHSPPPHPPPPSHTYLSSLWRCCCHRPGSLPIVPSSY